MRALITTGRMVQDQEFIYPFYRLQEAGYIVDVAIPGAMPCTGIAGVRIDPTRDVSGLSVADYEVLVLPGGVKAMEHLRMDHRILHFVSEFHASGKIIGSICSAAQLLISAKLVKGRQISGYYAMRDDIENAGGTFIDAPAVTFDRIVTSPHYKYLGQWMAAVLKAVADEKEQEHAGV